MGVRGCPNELICLSGFSNGSGCLCVFFFSGITRYLAGFKVLLCLLSPCDKKDTSSLVV